MEARGDHGKRRVEENGLQFFFWQCDGITVDRVKQTNKDEIRVLCIVMLLYDGRCT
jgi:hypothetical protein